MELHFISIFGLVLIAIAWLLLYRQLSRGKYTVSRQFAAIYATGVVFLILDGLASGLFDLVAMNLITCGAALLVLSTAKK